MRSSLSLFAMLPLLLLLLLPLLQAPVTRGALSPVGENALIARGGLLLPNILDPTLAVDRAPSPLPLLPSLPPPLLLSPPPPPARAD